MAIQEVDHVAHSVSGSEEGLKVHAANCHSVLVGERAGNTEQRHSGHVRTAPLCCSTPVPFIYLMMWSFQIRTSDTGEIDKHKKIV